MPHLYDDLLCRASLTDTGEIPRTPPLEESPDVIPVGTTTVADPLVHFTETYEQNVAKPVVAEEKNLIYVRGKNLAEVAQNGEVFVYWALQSQRNDPNVWKNNQLPTRDGHASFPVTGIAPGAILVATTPFEWTPGSQLVGQKVILLGVLATNEHPNPIPSLKPPFRFDTWITGKGGVGPFETTVAPAPPAAKTLSTDALFALANSEGVVTFTLRTSNLPIGSTVSFRSSQPDKDGKPIGGGPTKVTVNPFVLSVDATVDANFKTRIQFDLTLPAGQLPTADNSIGVSASQTPSGGTGPIKPVLLAQYNSQIKSPITA